MWGNDILRVTIVVSLKKNGKLNNLMNKGMLVTKSIEDGDTNYRAYYAWVDPVPKTNNQRYK